MEHFKNLAVFGADDCQNTLKTINLLQALDIRFKYIAFRDDRHEMSMRSKVPKNLSWGKPLVFINQKFIGDFGALKKYIQAYYPIL